MRQHSANVRRCNLQETCGANTKAQVQENVTTPRKTGARWNKKGGERPECATSAARMHGYVKLELFQNHS
eukprot:3433583-Amphidinium_carterae.1